MKGLVLLMVLTAAVFGQSSSSKKSKAPPKTATTTETKKATAKPAPKPEANASTQPASRHEVPKDAVKLSDFEWRWVDKDGKAWIYRRTPFGLAKFGEEKAASESEKQSSLAAASLEVRDAGDSVEFSKVTPFGTNKWTKKKSELDGIEKAAWDARKKQEFE